MTDQLQRMPAIIGITRRARPASILIVAAALASALFLCLQLVLGTSPLILILVGVGALAGCLPLARGARDAFAVLPAIFFFRYYGIAFIAKTVMFQSLELNLRHPLESYSLTTGLILLVSVLSALLRRLHARRPLLPSTVKVSQLPAAILIAALLGTVGVVLNVQNASRIGGIGSTGFLNQIGASIQVLYLLAVVLAVKQATLQTTRKTISPTLIILVGVAVTLSVALNAREFLVTVLVAYALSLLMRRALGWRHLLGGAVAITVFAVFLSPVVLESRKLKYGHTPVEYVAGSFAMAAKAATNPEYLAELREGLNSEERITQAGGGGEADYYGHNSGVLNRLSWIVLTDRIFDAAEFHNKLGFSTFPEATSQIAPRFLFPDKPVARYLYSDYLSYLLGLEEVGVYGARNFGLPMEGFTCFGILGFFLFPAIGLLVVLSIAAKVADLSGDSWFGIFVFASLQHVLFEQTSDGYFTMITRMLPADLLLSLLVIWLSGWAIRLTASRR